MTPGKRVAGALAAAAALSAGACGMFEDGPEAVDEETRLTELVNEGARLESELNEAELRVLADCLEERGHTVHDAYLMQRWEPEEVDGLVGGYPHEEFLPEREDAEQWAFGQWTGSEEAVASGENEAYLEARFGEEPGPPRIDNSEFAALPPETQYDWYAAYYGPEIAERDHGGLLDEGADPDEAGGDGAGGGDADADGAVEVEDGSQEEPPPGGCLAEMVEALYGEARAVVDAEDPEATYTSWEWRPAHPETEEDWNALKADYRDRIHEEEQAFLDCLAEDGLGEWAFDEYGGLPVFEYFAGVYEGSSGGGLIPGGETEADLPDPPADLPDDYEGRKAHEFALALGFVECGDRTGFREAARRAWDEARIDYHLAMEQELYAWQEAMRDAIARAQEHLDA